MEKISKNLAIAMGVSVGGGLNGHLHSIRRA
jgi:hypothetical protein